MGLLDKDITFVNCMFDSPHKWAWDLYIKGRKNHWEPSGVSMAEDIKDWKSKSFTDDERLVVKRCLGFFAGGESIVSNNLLINVFGFINDGMCRQYIIHQASEETVHNHTISYICSSLGLSIKEVARAYESIPSIKKKDDFLLSILKESQGNLYKADMIRNLFVLYIVCESIFFYSGFAMLLSFKRQGKLKGIGDQVNYTLIDETLHVEFGTNILNIIRNQYPDLFDEKLEEELVGYLKKAVELEIEYAKDVLPHGILGLNAEMFIDYIYYIANRRLSNLGFKFRFPKTNNPFPWLSEVMDLDKITNFFEGRVKEYSIGSLVDDL